MLDRLFSKNIVRLHFPAIVSDSLGVYVAELDWWNGKWIFSKVLALKMISPNSLALSSLPQKLQESHIWMPWLQSRSKLVPWCPAWRWVSQSVWAWDVRKKTPSYKATEISGFIYHSTHEPQLVHQDGTKLLDNSNVWGVKSVLKSLLCLEEQWLYWLQVLQTIRILT